MGRSLAADYHTAILTELGVVGSTEAGPSLPVDDEEFSRRAILKREYLDTIDALVQDICKLWFGKTPGDSCDFEAIEKIVCICRQLYALREGPCLGGQLVDEREAYLTASYLLSCSLHHSAVILAPKAWLFFPSLVPPPPVDPRVGESVERLTSPPQKIPLSYPGTMSLFPHTHALIDLGEVHYPRNLYSFSFRHLVSF